MLSRGKWSKGRSIWSRSRSTRQGCHQSINGASAVGHHWNLYASESTNRQNSLQLL